MAREILFWSLLLLALQPFRLRLAALAFLLIAHVDMSGPTFDSAGTVGWENAIKALILPAWLALVAGTQLSRRWPGEASRLLARLARSPYTLIWLLFVAYVSVAVLWSPYALAGAKLVMALVSHSLVFLALLYLWCLDRLSPRLILVAVLLTLAIAALQTFALGNLYGTGEAITRPRLTTFYGPQSFAENIVALGAVLVWSRSGVPAKLGAIGLLLGVAFATGSRIGFAGALAVVVIWLVRRLDSRRLVVGIVAIAGLSGLLLLRPVREGIAESRVGEVLSVVRHGMSGVSEVRTFHWREQLYRCIWDDIRERESAAIIFGTGTASIGVAGLRCLPRWQADSFSPNRVAHNEFLRVGYNQGLVGLLLGTLLLAGFLVFALRGFLRAGDPGDPRAWHSGPLASATPLLLLALSFEAFLQGSFSPGSVGFLVVLSQAVAARTRRRQALPAEDILARREPIAQ